MVLKWLKILVILALIGGIGALVLGYLVWQYFARDLPDYRTLADYQPAQITKLYTHDGQILAEYARERRIYTPIAAIPQPLIAAFLAAEDTSFYNHLGFDLKAILRAMVVNILTDRKQGASTITQQVAKNFLLTRDQTYERKIKELILARRIEQTFTKDEILELYLNQIYLGQGAYGVTAAAQTYFGKTLAELTVGERALIAGLPKAPSAYNPVRNPEAALARRNVILHRFAAEGIISPDALAQELAQPITLSGTALLQGDLAPYFSEQVRRELLETYGEDTVYTAGLRVHTTLDLTAQKIAQTALWRGVLGYDQRHGWRGPLGKITAEQGAATTSAQHSAALQAWLAENGRPPAQFGQPAVVLAVAPTYAEIGLANGDVERIPLAGLTWARQYLDADTRGPAVTAPAQVLSPTDVVLVQPLPAAQTTAGGDYTLSQIPAVQGAVVVMDNHSGAVRALIGGTMGGEGFNRAVQGQRQVGSVFKPFVYTAALAANYTPATVVLDAPVVFREGQSAWKPSNYTSRIHGETTLREALENSRNLVTIRVAQDIGLSRILQIIRQFNLPLDQLPMGDLTIALGSGSFRLLDVVSAYTAFPNLGVRQLPQLVTRVQNATGLTLQSGGASCAGCQPLGASFPLASKPEITTPGLRVLEPALAYQMVSLLQGVVERGTARRMRSLNRPLAGKTGTTNDFKDAWFVGFSPELTVGVWVGFDDPQTLGRGEAGGKVAAPIAQEIFAKLLAQEPVRNFQIPPGVHFVRIDPTTGLLPAPNATATRLEVFREGTAPTEQAPAGSFSFPGGTFEPFGLY